MFHNLSYIVWNVINVNLNDIIITQHFDQVLGQIQYVDHLLIIHYLLYSSVETGHICIIKITLVLSVGSALQQLHPAVPSCN